MWLLMADHTIKKSLSIFFDVLVKSENIIFSVDFVVLDCKVDFKRPIILGRPFLVTNRALVDMELDEWKFRQNNKEFTVNI